jgi:hypothetical protein
MMTKRVRKYCWGCVAVFAALILTSPISYLLVLNAYGPSTNYFSPYIEGAERLSNGKYVAFEGDRIFVRYTILRRAVNGDCLLDIHRYAENIAGPFAGRRHLIDYAELQFRGRDEIGYPRWPQVGLILGNGRAKDGTPDKNDPLIPPGEERQELAFYVVARYYCNIMDYFIPRYLQGGMRPNETERVNLILKRKKAMSNPLPRQRGWRSTDLVGVWKYIEAYVRFDDGTTGYNFTPDPAGRFIIRPNWYSHIVMSPVLPRVASGQLKVMTSVEAVAIATNLLAHYGTWTADPEAGTFTVQIEKSSFPNFDGITQVRDVTKLTDTELEYVNNTVTNGQGAVVVARLVRLPDPHHHGH